MLKKVKVFSAPWCAPCKALKALMETESWKADVFNIEDSTGSREARKYAVRSVPTVVLVDQNDGFLDSIQGFQGKSAKLKSFFEGQCKNQNIN